MKKRIAITGSKGVIGTILKRGLEGKYAITSLDLPSVDVRDYKRLKEIFPGHTAVIHLAWDTQTDNFRSEHFNPDNAVMFDNVYSAAIEAGVERVIMASSVHADRFYKEKALMKPETVPFPDSPYGAHKVFMEALGKWYAQEKSLEVVCIRFGGVNPENRPLRITDPKSIAQKLERAVWFSHRDCVSLVQKCLETRSIPGKFVVIYGISNNTGRLHDISNPLGWVPKDNNDEIDR